MTDPAALLTLVQWLSPGFPVGSYAYSHGLEAAIAGGLVGDAGALAGWIGTVLAEGSGRSDAILLAHALRGTAGVAELALALPASRERLAETLDLGTALSRLTNALTGQSETPAAYPVVLGIAARGLDLPPHLVLALYLQAFAANLVQVGVRFMPLGQTEGQAVLAALHPLILRLAGEAGAAALDEIGTGAFGSDLAAMRHETMDVRIYRT